MIFRFVVKIERQYLLSNIDKHSTMKLGVKASFVCLEVGILPVS